MEKLSKPARNLRATCLLPRYEHCTPRMEPILVNSGLTFSINRLRLNGALLLMMVVNIMLSIGIFLYSRITLIILCKHVGPILLKSYRYRYILFFYVLQVLHLHLHCWRSLFLQEAWMRGKLETKMLNMAGGCQYNEVELRWSHTWRINWTAKPVIAYSWIWRHDFLSVLM